MASVCGFQKKHNIVTIAKVFIMYSNSLDFLKNSSLSKMCMNGTRYQVRVDYIVSEEFEVMTGLKQGDTLSPILFITALEKVICSVQSNKLDINISQFML